jgi:RNA polymerase subunit RPABC4/transcription elongation factor Spt4
MFCPHCGSKVNEGSGVCQACGQEIIDFSGELEAQVVRSSAVETCLNCGAPLGQDELFCGQCGTRVSTDPSGETSLAAHPVSRVSTPPRRTRSRSAPPDVRAWEDSWHDAPSDEYNAPTQAYHRSQAARSTLRSAPLGRPRSRPISSYALADQPYLPPPPRSHAALIIGLLCFLASFISAGAAVWLAVTALH